MRVDARAAVKAARLVPNRAERKAAKKAAMKAFAEAFWTKPALTIVFDREGWSPALFRWLAEIGIATIIRRKGDPGEDWPESDFKKMRIPTFDEFGVERVREYLVAEKKVLLDTSEKKSGGGRKGKGKRKAKADDSDAKRIEEDYLEVREIRRLRSDGKQAAFVTTDFSAPLERIAGALFSRWAQENFSNTRRSGSISGGRSRASSKTSTPREPSAIGAEKSSTRNSRRKRIWRRRNAPRRTLRERSSRNARSAHPGERLDLGRLREGPRRKRRGAPRRAICGCC